MLDIVIFDPRPENLRPGQRLSTSDVARAVDSATPEGVTVRTVVIINGEFGNVTTYDAQQGAG